MYSSVESILAMLDRKHTERDIKQALADLEAMKGRITENAYKNTKALLEAKL